MPIIYPWFTPVGGGLNKYRVCITDASVDYCVNYDSRGKFDNDDNMIDIKYVGKDVSPQSKKIWIIW